MVSLSTDYKLFVGSFSTIGRRKPFAKQFILGVAWLVDLSNGLEVNVSMMMKCTIQERLRLVGGAAEHGGLQPSIPTSSPRAQSRPRLFSIAQNTYSKLASIPHPQIKSYTMQKKPNIKPSKETHQLPR